MYIDSISEGRFHREHILLYHDAWLYQEARAVEVKAGLGTCESRASSHVSSQLGSLTCPQAQAQQRPAPGCIDSRGDAEDDSGVEEGLALEKGQMEERMQRDQCLGERPTRQMLGDTTRVSKSVMGQAVGRTGGWEQQGFHHDDVIDSLNVSPIKAPRGAHTLSDTLSAEALHASPVRRMPPCIQSVPHLVSSS
jgi:hypothetical protein